MASVNKVILVGNVGNEPDARYMPNGDAVCNFSLATSESWKDRTSGEKKEITEWHRIVCYRKLADIVAQYVKKGGQLYIEGRLKTRKWTDKEGVEKYTTEIEMTEMKMLGARQPDNNDRQWKPPAARDQSAMANNRPQQQQQQHQRQPQVEDYSQLDDIPF